MLLYIICNSFCEHTSNERVHADAAPAPQVEVPDAIRRRQATQTIATAPEPINWLVRTEWSAQLSSTTLQQPSSNLAPQDSSNQAQLQDQAWFADPRKGIVMSAAGVQQSLPHLQLVRHSCLHA